MHGKSLFDKRVCVYMAKTQLRSYGDESQTEDATRMKPTKCFMLQTNTQTTKALGHSALFIDKDLMSREKLSSWFERRQILVEKISKWGLHGAIIQCESEDDESISMYSLGASLGITLDGKPTRSKHDVFSDLLSEASNNDILPPPL
ncbi:hypothetical protein Tco_0073919 [Tanacetum coccineum]